MKRIAVAFASTALALAAAGPAAADECRERGYLSSDQASSVALPPLLRNCQPRPAQPPTPTPAPANSAPAPASASRPSKAKRARKAKDPRRNRASRRHRR